MTDDGFEITIHGLLRKRTSLMADLEHYRDKVATSSNDIKSVDRVLSSLGYEGIDGGTGADVMRGGLGNDAYYIDNASDQIIETARGGFDKVYSSIDYQLG